MIDGKRLVRAIHLDAVRTGRGRYRVTGGAVVHVVHIDGDRRLTCDCADANLRPGITCKHGLAVLLRRGDPGTLAGLRELVPMPKRARRNAGASL